MKYLDSIIKLNYWLEQHGFKGYEAFDGLSSYLHLLTFRKTRRAEFHGLARG